MKIYLQDRSGMIELPRDIWVAEIGKVRKNPVFTRGYTYSSDKSVYL